MSEATTDSISDSPKFPILLWLLRPVVAIPLVIIVLIVAAPIVYRSMQFRGVPSIDPIVDPEVDGRVVLPGDENAFTFYRRAAGMHPVVSGSIADGAGVVAIDRGENWSVVPSDVRDYLEKCQSALATWKLGTKVDDGHYLDVADFDYSTLLPVVQDLRRFSRLAVLQMLRCQDEGKTDEAWGWLRASLRSSRHAGKHGVAIERLVGTSIHNQTARAIVHWAAQSEVSSEQLSEALADVREIYLLTTATSATMKAEAILAANTLADPHKSSLLLPKSSGIPKGLMRAYLFLKGDPELGRELTRHVFANYLSQCDLRPSDRVLAIARLGLYRPTGKEVPHLMDPARLSDAVMNSPIVWHLVAAQGQIIMACDLERSCQTALELCILFEMYRRQHGDYPKSINALVPEFVAEVPRDWLGTSTTEKMLCVSGKKELTSDDPNAPIVVRPCLIIYGRGRVAGDGGGDLRYDNDVGLRILLPHAVRKEERPKLN
jgi:hypothetical protein